MSVNTDKVPLSTPNAYSSLLDTKGIDENSEPQKSGTTTQKKAIIAFSIIASVVLLVVLSITTSTVTARSDCYEWEGTYYCPGDCLEQPGDHDGGEVYCPHSAEERVMKIYDFTVNTQAICNDGTMGRIHYSESLPGANQKNWIFRFEGGASCWDQDSCDRRFKDVNPNAEMMTAPTSPLIYQDPEGGTLNGDPAINPVFHDYHRVHTHYCSSDLYIGNSTPEENGIGYYFQGYNLVMGTMQEANKQWGLANAENILITGFSAGGMGVISISESIQEYLDEVAPNANVVYLCDGCWFMESYPDWGNFTCQSTDIFEECSLSEQYPRGYENWGAITPASCQPHFTGEEWKCILPEHNLRYMTTREQIHVIESLYDYRLNDLKTAADSPDPVSEEWTVGLAQAILDSIIDHDPGSYFAVNCFNHDAINERHVYNTQLDGETYPERFVTFINEQLQFKLADVAALADGSSANSTNPSCPMEDVEVQSVHVD